MILTCFAEALIMVALSSLPAELPAESVTGARWAACQVEFLAPAAPFEAWWIGPPPDAAIPSNGGVFEARRTVRVSNPESWRSVRVSADSAYVLWVNGVEVFRGPALFDPWHQMYDTLDLSPYVRRGENAVAARIICWSDPTIDAPYRQVRAMPAFLFDAPELKTDKGWQVRVCAGYRNAGRENTRGGGAAHWHEHADGATLSRGMSQPGFPEGGDWLPAREMCLPVTRPAPGNCIPG